MKKIENNEELAEFCKKAIKASGIKKNDLAERIGLSRQGLDNLLKKKSFSLDDANKILSVLSLAASIKVTHSLDKSMEIFLPPKVRDLIE